MHNKDVSSHVEQLCSPTLWNKNASVLEDIRLFSLIQIANEPCQMYEFPSGINKIILILNMATRTNSVLSNLLFVVLDARSLPEMFVK